MDDSGAPFALADDLDALFRQLEAQHSPAATPPPDPALAQGAPMAALVERRLSPRRAPDHVGRDVKLTVRGASEAQPINLSETGVLAETTSRLLPGTVVELLLQIDGVRHLLRATIVRSVVHSLSPRPIFRTAFRFEEPTKLPERH